MAILRPEIVEGGEVEHNDLLEGVLRVTQDHLLQRRDRALKVARVEPTDRPIVHCSKIGWLVF